LSSRRFIEHKTTIDSLCESAWLGSLKMEKDSVSTPWRDGKYKVVDGGTDILTIAEKGIGSYAMFR